MTRFRRTLVALTLALWWPATVHCGLEVLTGSAWLECATESDACTETTCETDGCALIEGGQYRPPHPNLDVAPPVSWLSESLLCDASRRRSGSGAQGFLIAGGRDTVVAVRRWHFERRAAPLARAPSVVQV